MTSPGHPGAAVLPRPPGKPRGECETRDEDALAATFCVVCERRRIYGFDEADSESQCDEFQREVTDQQHRGFAPDPRIYRFRARIFSGARRPCGAPRISRPPAQRSGRVPAEPYPPSGSLEVYLNPENPTENPRKNSP